MRRSNPKRSPTERYEIDRSPLAQLPTQRDIGDLVGESRDDLRRLINYKNEFIVRRDITQGPKGKQRKLAYPVGRLRGVHERLRFHLSKVRQPSYLFSPRRGYGQRDNAAVHLDQLQYLTLDLKKFYPSTSDAMVRTWLRNELRMYDDVAGLMTHLCTVDGRVSLGSPLTPVLCSLVHRRMFDQIAAICDARGLRYTVWVDDLTISGRFVPGEVIEQIRDVIRNAGLKSHSVAFKSGNRPVFITGIGIVGRNLVAPNSLHLRIGECWVHYHMATTDDEKDNIGQTLLSHLGTLRHIVGAASPAGQKAASQMNSLRQERTVRSRWKQERYLREREARPKMTEAEAADSPF